MTVHPLSEGELESGEFAGSEGNSRYPSGFGNEARLSAGAPGSGRQKPNRNSR